MGAIAYVGAGGQENKVNTSICWYTGHGFDPHGRGNFPGHDVLGGLTKSVKYGCKWTNIGVDGCSRTWGHGGNAKQQKENRKCA